MKNENDFNFEIPFNILRLNELAEKASELGIVEMTVKIKKLPNLPKPNYPSSINTNFMEIKIKQI